MLIAAEDPEVEIESRGAPVAARPSRATTAIAFVWLLAVTIYATWPLARFAPSRVAGDLKDPLENAWIFGWAEHAVVHQPLHLFGGNIFNPERYTLAYAENLLGLSLPVAPIFWLTHNAILAVNIALLLTFAVAGIGVFMLVREVSGMVVPAILAATAYSVAPYRLAQITHPHVVATHLLPFILLVLMRMGREEPSCRRRRLVVALALLVGLQFWSSITGGLLAVAMASTWAAWELARQKRRSIAVVLRAAAGIALGIGLSLPVLLPYMAVKHLHPEYQPPADVVRFFSASPSSYLTPRPRGGPLVEPVYRRLRQRVARGSQPSEELQLFPGLWLTAGAIGAAAVLARAGRRRPHRTHPELVALGLALAATGLVLSLGPNYGRRSGGLPLPMAAVASVTGGITRVPARMGMLVPFGLALAGGGVLALVGERPRRWLTAASILLLALELAPSSVIMRQIPPITAAHRAIATRPGAVLALPTAEFDYSGEFDVSTLLWTSVPRESIHMYLSTANFRPMINGYGAYFPSSYWRVARAVQDFPSRQAFVQLAYRNVRTLVVQTELVHGTRWAQVVPRLERWPGVEEIGRGDGVRVYDISHARTTEAGNASTPLDSGG